MSYAQLVRWNWVLKYKNSKWISASRDRSVAEVGWWPKLGSFHQAESKINVIETQADKKLTRLVFRHLRVFWSTEFDLHKRCTWTKLNDNEIQYVLNSTHFFPLVELKFSVFTEPLINRWWNEPAKAVWFLAQKSRRNHKLIFKTGSVSELYANLLTGCKDAAIWQIYKES